MGGRPSRKGGEGEREGTGGGGVCSMQCVCTNVPAVCATVPM